MYDLSAVVKSLRYNIQNFTLNRESSSQSHQEYREKNRKRPASFICSNYSINCTLGLVPQLGVLGAQDIRNFWASITLILAKIGNPRYMNEGGLLPGPCLCCPWTFCGTDYDGQLFIALTSIVLQS